MTSSYKRFFIVIGILIAATALILTLLPFGIEYGIVKALHDQGAEDASVENVDFNPFTGRFVLQGLTIRKGDKTPFNLTEFALQISWRSLFKKRLYLEDLAIEGTTIAIEQTDDNRWNVGGLEIPGDKKKEETSVETEVDPGSPWGFGVEHLAIRSSNIKFKGMDLDTEFNIQDLSITDIKSWEPGLPTLGALSGGINGSSLKIKTDALPFSESPSVKGSFSLDKLSLLPINAFLPKDGKLSLDNGSVSLAGSFEFITGQEEDQINFSGGVTVEDLSVGGPSETKFLELQKLDLLEIEVAGLNDISIQSIELKGTKLLLQRKPDGKWNFIDDTAGVQEKEAEEKAPVNEKAEPIRIRIADIIIEDNSIRFEDESVDPPYRTELMIDKVEVHDIDTSSPDKTSTWAVAGKMGDYSSLSFSGNIQPLAEKLTMDLTGNIEELDLHPLSPYTLKALGYNVQSGHLNTKIDIKITSGNIKSENGIVLKKLEISPEDETKMDALVTELGLSLESALSLLRDSDGTIRLTLPIEGDVDNPDIQLGEIINKALGNAMQKTAFSYLKHVFQPYGALITIVELAGEAARIKLDPVEFEAGADILNESAGEYMKTVIKLLKERPELEISVCGKVTQADIDVLNEKALQALREKIELSQTEEQKKVAADAEATEPLTVELSDEELLEFARSRAVHIKELLTKEHGIESGRLFICNPEINREEVKEGEEEKPRAELLI